MNREEARELMKENFDEISQKEWEDVEPDIGEVRMECKDGRLCFKPKQKLPIVFEDEFRIIRIWKDKIKCEDLNNSDYLVFREEASLPLLIEAVDKWKDLQ